MNFKKIILLGFLQGVNLLFAQKSPLDNEHAVGPPPPSLVKHDTDKTSSETATKILETASEPPQFPGGIHAFRNKILNIFDTENVNGKGTVSAECTFVIERDGSISTVKVNGQNASMNAEAERTLKALAKKIKWEPAKHNGTLVRSRQRMPLTVFLD